ncbi:hypothetical protein [Rhodoferax sp.]|uniref:hypothetical protein n=1 Tax=Rhodoferax sp. TaxID=50421 RepID=UPI002744C217|nr:hypothetical protein [Rhodoferax sp.]
MSLFTWFTKKVPTADAATEESSGLGHIDATVPIMPSSRMKMKATQSAASNAANRKTERLERRELLYGVVRESMTRAGVLAASYKFKVLSLDPRGQQYLVMMDLANQSAGDTNRLAEIEALIAQGAKVRHNIEVTAVYWRVNEHVTTGLSKPRTPNLSTAQVLPIKRPLPAATPIPRPASARTPQFEPLQADEVEAFKRALSTASRPAPLAPSGTLVKSGRRNPAPPVEFEDTELVEGEDRASPLSGTQYGDLN